MENNFSREVSRKLLPGVGYKPRSVLFPAALRDAASDEPPETYEPNDPNETSFRSTVHHHNLATLRTYGTHSMSQPAAP